jgi:hypothetical protein
MPEKIAPSTTLAGMPAQGIYEPQDKIRHFARSNYPEK